MLTHLYLILHIIHRLREDLDVELPDGIGVAPLVRPPTHVELRADGPKIEEVINDLVRARPTLAQGTGVVPTPTGSGGTSATTASSSLARRDLLRAKGCGRNDLLVIELKCQLEKTCKKLTLFKPYPGNVRVVVPCIRIRHRVPKHLVLQLVERSFDVEDVV